MVENKKIPILVIVGPTAVGKTSFAIEAARALDGEIIGLDSRQIYTGMAIGTAQPTRAERSAVPHHLIAFRSPTQKISAGEFAEISAAVIDDIHQRRKVPILCGGAGLYYRALSRGIFSDSKNDLEIRGRLIEEYDRLGAAVLMDRLMEVDPDYAAKVHPNNRNRLVRALEIYEITGVPPTKHFEQQPVSKYPFALYTIFLTRTMKDLEDRIRQRTGIMLEDGWLDETRQLMKFRGDTSFHAMDSIGYIQVMDYLNDKISYAEMEKLIILRTRQYAKSQMTWFRKEPVDLTMNLSEGKGKAGLIEKIIREYRKFAQSVCI